MKSLCSHAIAGAVLGLFLCGPLAYAQQAASPESRDQATGTLAEAVPADGMDVREYVSSALEPTEREYMRNAVNNLPARTREKILGMDPGKVSITIYDGAQHAAHYNRPELAGTVHMEPDVALPGDDYPYALKKGGDEDPSADLSRAAPICPSKPAPGCFAGSGPYRRVYTQKVKAEPVCPSGVARPCTGKYLNDPDTGYWNTGEVTVGCKAGSFLHTATVGEAGYIYLGGWSPTADATGGIVDAGLQYNYELSVDPKSADDYSLFLKVSNAGKLISTSSPGTGYHQPEHIPCNNSERIALEFHVSPWDVKLDSRAGCKSSKTVTSPFQLPGCGTVALIVQRAWGNCCGTQVIVWLTPNIAYGGWGQIAQGPVGQNKRIEYFPQVPCGGCVFKWMTSIAQNNTNGKKENLSDGSHFGSTWSNRGIAPWAEPGVKVPSNGDPVPVTAALIYCSEYPVWTIYDAASLKGDCSNTPKVVAGVAADVQVSKYTDEGETDTITLTKPKN